MIKNKQRTLSLKSFWSIALAVLILDQISKVLIQNLLGHMQIIPVIPGFFNIVHILNKGAVFGLLNQSGSAWVSYLLIFFNLGAIIAIVLITHIHHLEGLLFYLGLSLILGGAFGNLTDRILIGQVVDFLDFHVKQLHWPAFNIADLCISTGTILLFIYLFKKGHHAPDTD